MQRHEHIGRQHREANGLDVSRERSRHLDERVAVLGSEKDGVVQTLRRIEKMEVS